MNNLVQMTFDYDSLDIDTRTFVQQIADETHGLLKRTAENIIKIGQNLLEVKERLPHGQFMPWVQSEFEMSQMSAVRFMQVAEKFGDKLNTVLNFSPKVLYELSSPSMPQTVIEQVESGEISPTLDAIKEAKEFAKRAEEAEQRTRAEKEVTQYQLLQARTQVQELNQQIETSQQQIATLHHQLVTIHKPDVQIKEVEKQVIPQETLAQLERLRRQVAELTEQRNNLAKEAEELGEIARTATQQRQERERDDRIRQQWRTTCITFNQTVLKALSQWPTPIDTQVFEGDDWSYLSQAQETAQRFLQECTNLRGKQEWIVDAVEA